MPELMDGGGMKYCPSCRNVMEYQGEGKYECLLCCIHVVILNKDPDFYYEIPFTEEEREAYYTARRAGIRNRVFFERERERETKKKEAVQREQNILNRISNGNQEQEEQNREPFDVYMASRTLSGQVNVPLKEDTKQQLSEQQSIQQPNETSIPIRKCKICGKPIPSGVYCKECTFEQIKKMQRKDNLGR